MQEWILLINRYHQLNMRSGVPSQPLDEYKVWSWKRFWTASFFRRPNPSLGIRNTPELR